ncbi:MAG: tyrosine-type recombinase/integrase [Candidatus Angelobacter sp.]
MFQNFEVAELHRLFDELALRERAMIICDALTGMRRIELMGLKWQDLDFIELRINIVRSVVDQVIGQCKTETSRKPVVMDEHIAQALIAWRQESTYTAPSDWVWASPHKAGNQVAGRGCESGPGTPAACFLQNDDGWVYAGS